MPRTALLSTFRPLARSTTLAPLTRPSLRHASDYSHLNAELTSRQLPVTYDYLVPTPSHLLNISLRDILPAWAAPATPTGDAARVLPSTSTDPSALPPAHHLVFFPPAIPGADLLPDGTDPLQSPGAPFVRRMWAGGAVSFNPAPDAPALTQLSGQRAACLEAIRDVTVKGAPGDEKIFVGIERRIGRTLADTEPDASIRQRFWTAAPDDFGAGVALIERRNIVFLRERSREQAARDMAAAARRQLAPPEGKPDWTHEFVPDARLLFRYSALTYNAHAIHLDPAYCREVEGHRGLLVHGPLSFTLLLTLTERGLARGETVGRIEYRNLSPLYAGERLRLCGKKVAEGKGDWEVWAETPEGGVAVKATVWTAKK